MLDARIFTTNLITEKIETYICTAIVAIILFSCNHEIAGEKNSQVSGIPSAQEKESIQSVGHSGKIYVGKNIRCIFQDESGNFWFGTEGEGICKYDGSATKFFTTQDGLCSDYVRTIQEYSDGTLWFGTREGICRYDGKSFKTFADANGVFNLNTSNKFHYKHGDLLFGTNGGVYCYDGNTFYYYELPLSNVDSGRPSNFKFIYGVYSTMEDRDGNVWFGTGFRGACRFDGKEFKYFTENGLSKNAIRSIYQDKNGLIWFNPNGQGLITYDGKTFHNFSEEKQLSHDLAHGVLQDENQKLNRVFSICEDNFNSNSNIWFTTIDEGVWKYDHHQLINYSTKSGLISDTVWTVYRDKTGVLWFGTESKGVFIYNGVSFIPFGSSLK